ncbi:MAG TPA: hypothetical protein VFI03_12665 [Solirubrobacterales bacterium]|nr:hypothetical protein [Solirubrobacterales bacterium]
MPDASTMKPRHWVLVIGLLLALAGAVLAFALEDSDASWIGISLQPLGGVLFVAGILLAGGVAVGAMGDGSASSGGGHNDINSLKAIGGLIAVVSGVVSVAALAAFTLTRFNATEEGSAVAVASSAFGVISAVVGAYLGIKVTADHSSQVAEDVKHAAVAEHDADIAHQKLNAMTDKVGELAPDHLNEVKAAGFKAAEEATRGSDPQSGGGVS